MSWNSIIRSSLGGSFFFLILGWFTFSSRYIAVLQTRVLGEENLGFYIYIFKMASLNIGRDGGDGDFLTERRDGLNNIKK